MSHAVAAAVLAATWALLLVSGTLALRASDNDAPAAGVFGWATAALFVAACTFSGWYVVVFPA